MDIGKHIEELTATYLKDCGYDVIARRYKTKLGEIDIIATIDQYIVFVEVKFRKNMTDSFEAISLRQQKRIRNAAELFISERDLLSKNYGFRFDAILWDKRLNMRHIENAF